MITYYVAIATSGEMMCSDWLRRSDWTGVKLRLHKQIYKDCFCQ